MASLRTGFVGLQDTGGLLAAHVAGTFSSVAVFDADPERVSAFKGTASRCGSPAEVGALSDIVGVYIVDEGQLRAALTGPDGLFDGLNDNAIVLVHAVVDLEVLRDLVRAATARKISILDAMPTGDTERAEKGTLCTVVGGSAALVDHAKPFIHAFSSQIIHAGPTGSGVALKACYESVLKQQDTTVREAFRLAQALGIAPEALARSFSAAAGLSDTLRALLHEQQNASPCDHADPSLVEMSFDALAVLDLDELVERVRSRQATAPLPDLKTLIGKVIPNQ